MAKKKDKTNENIPEIPNLNLGTQLEISNRLNAIIARTETLNIAVDIINAFLAIIQKSETPFTQEQLDSIQSVVNGEAEKTKQIYDEVEKLTQEINLDTPEVTKDAENE